MANRRAGMRGGHAASGPSSRRGARPGAPGGRPAGRGGFAGGGGRAGRKAENAGLAGGDGRARGRTAERGGLAGGGRTGGRPAANAGFVTGGERDGFVAADGNGRRGPRRQAERGGLAGGAARGKRAPERGGFAPARERRVPDSAQVDAAADTEREFVAGRRAVMEALKGDRSLNRILIQEEAAGGSLTEILGLAREQGVVVQRVPRSKLDEIAHETRHQGVLAYISAKAYVELEDLIELARKCKPGLMVVLDGIEDPHNLGSVIRTAEGSGAVGVVISKRRAVPLTGTVAKASAGALEYVEVARVPNLSQAIDRLKDAGFWVVGAATETGQQYYEADFTGPTAIVIGGEGSGLSRLTAEHCDFLVRIPMRGKVESLNAGVAAGILLYEAVRQRAML